MRKFIVAAITLLFFCVIVVPTVDYTTVKASTQDELVEVTSEMWSIRESHRITVTITRQDYQELNQYFIDFQGRLNQTTSRKEAVQLYEKALVDLNHYGILGNLSDRQVRRLAKTLFDNPRVETDENQLSMIVGRTNQTDIVGPLPKLLWNLVWWIPHPFDQIFVQVVIWPLVALNTIQPFLFLADILMERSYGWVWSLGLHGLKTWNGILTGMEPSPYQEPNIAVLGFTGLHILLHYKTYDHFYLGYALDLKIDQVR